MKNLNTYINEKLKITKSNKPSYNYFPKTKEELQDLLIELIEERGPEGDFNDIDTSEITDMSELFCGIKEDVDIEDFNGNISKWDVFNVTTMESMFEDCIDFNGDLSEWDISNVRNMEYMFNNCHSFEGIGLENWDVSEVKYMNRMFSNCDNLDIDKTIDWNPIKIVNMDNMFVNVKKQFTKVPDWILL